MIAQILVIGVVIALTAWYMQRRFRRWRRLRLARNEMMRNMIVQHANGLEVFSRRYARGEIDLAEYLQKKDDIVGAQAPLEDHSLLHDTPAQRLI
jgi:uncharacterized membrane protein